MNNATHVTKVALLVLCLLIERSRAEEKEKLQSIGEMNRVAGKNFLDLEDAFGPSLKLMRLAKRIEAVLLGDLEQTGIEKYRDFPLRGKSIEVDLKSVAFLLSENFVGLWPAGTQQPRLAFIYFGEKAEDKVVLLMVPPEDLDNREGFWTLLECSSERTSYLLPIKAPFISEIFKKLKVEQEKSTQSK
jgi:hypothetical protein